jgi:hypothetical protein
MAFSFGFAAANSYNAGELSIARSFANFDFFINTLGVFCLMRYGS